MKKIINYKKQSAVISRQMEHSVFIGKRKATTTEYQTLNLVL